jgi:thiol-disulfide isomerase/thioredoxin
MTSLCVALPGRSAAWLAAAILAVTASSFAVAREPPKNFVLHDAPKPVAAVAFENGQGQPQNLADFKGKVVLLNIWATWCVPCRKEMPALDRLQGTLGGSGFEVIPVSIDRGGLETVRKFHTEIGVHNVRIYIDSSGKVLPALAVVGLPTTLLIDRAGREIGRIVGPAEWDAPEMVGFLTPIIAEPDDAAQRDAGNGENAAATPQRDEAGGLQLGFRWLKALFLTLFLK